MSSLAEILTTTAARHPERIALRLDERAVSYAELERDALRVAGFVRAHGVGPDDRVGLMLPNVPEFAAAYFGILLAGGVVVPMNPLLRRREVDHYLGDSGARLLLAQADAVRDWLDVPVVTVEPGWLAQADPLDARAARDPSDTAVLLYTSGTTGKPKGAELTHENLRRNAYASAALFAFGPEDVTLGALPLFHSFGQTCALNASVATGGCLTLVPRFEAARALEVIARDGVTIFEGVPTMYNALLSEPRRRRGAGSTLRVALSGGAPMPVELLRAFEAAFGCTILEGYGLSETSPVASFNRPDGRRKPGSIGFPIDGVEMRVVDDDGRALPTGEVGEIAIRGHCVMKGYWRSPAATARALRGGWFHSGDVGRVDEDGFFFVVDRKKDMIIRGGYNVYPREVEEVLYEHPAVREAAVVGIPDSRWGEEVGAAVALKDGADVDAEGLRAFVRERLAAYKYPREIWFVDELPKGPTGKILRREVRPPSC